MADIVIQWIKISCVILLYWTTSIGMIFINKYLFSNESIDLRAPLFVTWFQNCIGSLIIWLLGLSGIFIPSISKVIPKINLKMDMIKTLFPLSALTITSIVFKNLTLANVPVAFYNTSLSLAIIIVVIFSRILLKQTISLKVFICCLVTALGFSISLNQELILTNLPYIGLFYGLLSSISGPLSQIYLKKKIEIVKNISIITFYNCFISIFLLPPIIYLVGEAEHLFDNDKLYNLKVWGFLSLSGIFSIMIGYVISLQISVTSPLTANISGIGKNCLQTVIAVIVSKHSTTFYWWLGISSVLAASGFYSAFKMLEMKSETETLLTGTNMQRGDVNMQRDDVSAIKIQIENPNLEDVHSSKF